MPCLHIQVLLALGPFLLVFSDALSKQFKLSFKLLFVFEVLFLFVNQVGLFWILSIIEIQQFLAFLQHNKGIHSFVLSRLRIFTHHQSGLFQLSEPLFLLFDFLLVVLAEIEGLVVATELLLMLIDDWQVVYASAFLPMFLTKVLLTDLRNLLNHMKRNSL